MGGRFLSSTQLRLRSCESSRLETGYSKRGEERKTLQVIFGNGIAEKNRFPTLWNAKHKGFKSFAQHCCVFPAVVSEPSFPQCVGPNAVVGDDGFAIGDDVFDVLTRTQLHATSKELLRSNRRDACFLVVTWLSCDPFAHYEILDLHISTG